MRDLAGVNEQSIAFLLRLFAAAAVSWRPSTITYFSGYDSKVFFTHHWGSGLSSSVGSFMVFDPSKVSLGLAVHENAHTLLSDNWGWSSSFMVEGFGRYAESMATDPDRDHQQTRSFARQGRLLGLEEMSRMNIGPSAGTDIAYPASGSFIGYLVTAHGLDAARRAYTMEARTREEKAAHDTWHAVFGRSLQTLEAEWRRWIERPTDASR
jgi:hypothetical protein